MLVPPWLLVNLRRPRSLLGAPRLQVRLSRLPVKIFMYGCDREIAASFEDRRADWADSIGRRLVLIRPMAGWRPLENWSAPHLADTPAYILDDQPKVTVGGDEPRMISEAIDNVRERLGNHRSATRLIGLSGLGKTRFAQALFDELVGQNALNAAMVVYGDLSQSPATIPEEVKLPSATCT